MSFLEELKNRILIADGAMGTLLYSFGTDSCYEQLNLTYPETIREIHQSYIDAGANIIQTNSYAANKIKLSRYGLENKVKEINEKAVIIARDAAKENIHVLGTMGGIRGVNRQSFSLSEITDSFQEQLFALLQQGVDGLLLETFYDFEELETILTYCRKETDIPIIAQLTIQEPGYLQNRMSLNDAFRRLEELGANIVGLNCRLGPHHMLKALETVILPKHAFLSAYPNASLPGYTDGKFHFNGDAEYFRRSALAFRNEGIRLLGGCCGTTPNHIRAFSEALKDIQPIYEKEIILNKATVTVASRSTMKREKALHEIVEKRKSIIVELDPPKTLHTEKFFQGAKALKEVGIDAITLADNSLASPRIENSALGYLTKEKIGLRPLIHITCRDRNLIGIQSHLMGLHTLGLHDVLAVTGDPARVGDFPGASSVYDVSSFELIQMIKNFNEGLSASGKNLGQKSNFSVAAAFNPNVRHLDKAVLRMEKKIQYGADYFITQPVYSEEKIKEIHNATKHITKPIYLGLMPIISSKNAEFLHNEVPGMKISSEIRAKMASLVDDPLRAIQEGIAITKSLIDCALEWFDGIYLITPFLKYEISVQLSSYFLQQAKKLDFRRNEHVQSPTL